MECRNYRLQLIAVNFSFLSDSRLDCTGERRMRSSRDFANEFTAAARVSEICLYTERNVVQAKIFRTIF